MLPRCCWFRCPGGTLFSSSPPPRRHAVSPVALGGSTSTRPRSGREGWRVLAVGLFVFTTAALRRLSDSGLGLDIDTPPEWLRGAAYPRRRPRLRHHHRNIGRQSAREPRTEPRFGRPWPSTRCSRLLPSALRLAPAKTHVSFSTCHLCELASCKSKYGQTIP